MTGTLSALGHSDNLFVRPGQSLTYSLLVGDGDSFIGTIVLERSTTLQTWDALAVWTGTVGVPLTGAVVSGTVQNTLSKPAHYRFAVWSLDESSDGIGYALADVALESDGQVQADGHTVILEPGAAGTDDIPDAAVTLAKMANMATDSLIGRDTAGAGTPEIIALGAGLEMSGLGALRVADAGITKAKMANIGTDKLIGRDTAATGVPEEIGVGGGLEFDGSGNVQIAAKGVTLAKMNDMATDSLLGRDTAAAGAPEVIALGSGLEMSGAGALRIATAGVSKAMLADIGTDRLLGRDTAATGVPEEIALGAGLEFDGSGNIRVADGGIAAAKLAAGAVFDFTDAQNATVVAVAYDDSFPKSILTADATHDRIALVMAKVTAVFSAAASVLVGAESDPDGAFSISGPVAAGVRLFGLIPVPAGEAIKATLPGAAPTAGAMSVSVLTAIESVPDAAVTNAKLALMARGRIKAGAGTTGGPASDLDVSAAGAIPIGDGTDVAAHALTGDVTMSAGGVTAIGAGRVTSAMLANGAGVAALLASGLGGSAKVVKTDVGLTALLLPDATKDRVGLVIVVVDETYDIGTGTLPTVLLATDVPSLIMADTVLTDQVAGTVLCFGFALPATKTFGFAATAKVGDATGGCSITVLALPTT